MGWCRIMCTMAFNIFRSVCKLMSAWQEAGFSALQLNVNRNLMGHHVIDRGKRSGQLDDLLFAPHHPRDVLNETLRYLGRVLRNVGDAGLCHFWSLSQRTM